MTSPVSTESRLPPMADGDEAAQNETKPATSAELSPFEPRRPTRRARVLMSLGIVAVLVVAAVFAWWVARGKATPATTPGHNHGAATESKSEQPVMLSADQARRIGVTYSTATVEPLAAEVRTVAQVTFDETRVKAIAPKLDGWIDQLYVNYTGQPVHAGDPLLSIYSPMLVQAQQELLLAAQLQRDVANAAPDSRAGADGLREAARRRLLYWDITPSDIDRIERTGEVQKTIVLRAPVNGVVVEKNVLAGQKIMAGDALYRVADLRIVWVEGEVFERDLATVHVGQSVQAEFQALPGERRTGRITYIYPTINPETRTARVRVEMANPDLALKPGMYATIRIQGASRERVLTLPRSAVLSTGERNLAFVRRPDGMLEPRNVTLGATNDERVEVLSGIREGETVVASATFLVDAESNLGSQLGGMGNMPGMDMSAPTSGPGSAQSRGAVPAPAPNADTPHKHQ